jgi:ribonuclease HII
MIGVDEVGRGCWAGPLLVVAARTSDKLPTGIIDSKLLNRAEREALIKLLLDKCQFGEGWVTVTEIDKYGLAKALRLGGQRALLSLKATNGEKIILDGRFNYLPKSFKSVVIKIKADVSTPIVSAASIYAKVRRDNFMRLVSEVYPTYGFAKHVGYGTKFHQSALLKYGVLKTVHRHSFRPINQISLSI